MAREGINIIHSDGTTETWYATSATVGSEVSANPTLSGDEEILTGIDINGTNYKSSYNIAGEIFFDDQDEPHITKEVAENILKIYESGNVPFLKMGVDIYTPIDISIESDILEANYMYIGFDSEENNYINLGVTSINITYNMNTEENTIEIIQGSTVSAKDSE